VLRFHLGHQGFFFGRDRRFVVFSFARKPASGPHHAGRSLVIARPVSSGHPHLVSVSIARIVGLGQAAGE
jgi:hypothetical protein